MKPPIFRFICETGYESKLFDAQAWAKRSLEDGEWVPKYSFQTQKERNCGQHCVAMITHLPVSFICGEMKKKNGTITKEVEGILRWLGYDSDVTLTKYKKGMVLPDLCVLHVQNHWCLHFKGFVFDSNLGIFRLDTDTRRIKSFLKVEIPKIRVFL